MARGTIKGAEASSALLERSGFLKDTADTVESHLARAAQLAQAIWDDATTELLYDALIAGETQLPVVQLTTLHLAEIGHEPTVPYGGRGAYSPARYLDRVVSQPLMQDLKLQGLSDEGTYAQFLGLSDIYTTNLGTSKVIDPPRWYGKLIARPNLNIRSLVAEEGTTLATITNGITKMKTTLGRDKPSVVSLVEYALAGDFSNDPNADLLAAVAAFRRARMPAYTAGLAPKKELPKKAAKAEQIIVRPATTNPADEKRGEAPDNLDWQEFALCAQTDHEAFFPDKGGSTREAKQVCGNCEVRIECLDYALNKDERFGIWGGLSERERRKLKKRPK